MIPTGTVLTPTATQGAWDIRGNDHPSKASSKRLAQHLTDGHSSMPLIVAPARWRKWLLFA
jgi:hypothetical protein